MDKIISVSEAEELAIVSFRDLVLSAVLWSVLFSMLMILILIDAW